jgi:hypothetical protein
MLDATLSRRRRPCSFPPTANARRRRSSAAELISRHSQCRLGPHFREIIPGEEREEIAMSECAGSRLEAPPTARGPWPPAKIKLRWTTNSRRPSALFGACRGEKPVGEIGTGGGGMGAYRRGSMDGKGRWRPAADRWVGWLLVGLVRRRPWQPRRLRADDVEEISMDRQNVLAGKSAL